MDGMIESLQKFHLDVLQYHDSIMFEELIYPHNIVSEGVKSLVFEDKLCIELKPMRGYFAVKEESGTKKKYFIEEQYYANLPIRANNCQEIFFKDSQKSKSIVNRPLNPTPFKIMPKEIWKDAHEFVDMILPFKHSNPDHWTLHKMVAIMGYVGKTFIGDCSISEFGKSSIYEVLNSLTKKSPVFQPRSVAGVLVQITGNGNMVFDEVGDTTADTKRCMENFTLQVGGNKPVYINGALSAKNTKAKYNVGEQSITFLYNTVAQYRKEEEFFDNMFNNNVAIDSRLLKLKFDGILEEKFDKNFNMMEVAQKNKMFYVDIAKHLLYLKELKITNGYQRRYIFPECPKLNGRKKRIYDEITWLIDMYAKSETEYVKFIVLLNNCINEYKSMVGHSTYQIIKEEEVVSDLEKMKNFIREKKSASYEEIEWHMKPVKIEGMINELAREGDIFEPRRGYWGMLE